MSTTHCANYRKSGFLLTACAALIYILLLMRGNHHPYIALIAVVLMVVSFFEMWPLRKTVDVLIDFGNFVHRFTNPLLFGLIYVVAVIPTALLLKLCGKEILHLRRDGDTASYWQTRTNGKTWIESFRKQY